jgi:hypothetical protein
MIDINHLIAQIQTTIAEPYGKPTDLIGFNKDLANALTTVISRKEICFFDENIKSDDAFHYLDFPDMLEKTEIMIFVVELSEKYYNYLPKLNKNVKIFIPAEYKNTITALEKFGFRKNMLYCE